MKKSPMVSKIKSPLRYPGGKSRAAKVIMPYFPDVKEMCSPFGGGLSIEIACAAKGIRVHAYDIFKPLNCFWDYLIKDRQALYNEVQKLHPMSREQFVEYQKLNPVMEDSIERAAMFYALNRASFSGSTMSGGMSPQHPRFNDSNMLTLLEFNLPTLSVGHLDCLDAIKKHPDIFLYLDPPYLLEQKQSNSLYGEKGSTHKDFNHKALFEALKDRKNWIMSYNNSKDILKMYEDFIVIQPQWAYGMSEDKTAKEALIFSKDTDQNFLDKVTAEMKVKPSKKSKKEINRNNDYLFPMDSGNLSD